MFPGFSPGGIGVVDEPSGDNMAHHPDQGSDGIEWLDWLFDQNNGILRHEQPGNHGNQLTWLTPDLNIAIQVLKSLMMKHTFDDRYAAKSQQARLSTLYLPLFGLLLENVHRLDAKDSVTVSGNHANAREDSLVTPLKTGSICLDSALHKDVFGAISGTASPHPSTSNTGSVLQPGSRASLVSTDSCNSLQDKSRDRTNSLEK
ncbi:hypothetical protein CRUP_006549, partial [Coryphaenoides rupestris]